MKILDKQQCYLIVDSVYQNRIVCVMVSVLASKALDHGIIRSNLRLWNWFVAAFPLRTRH